MTPRGRDALDRLLVGECFAQPEVGYSATLSNEARDLLDIIEDREGASAIAFLFENGSIVGRLYALIGTWEVSPASYEPRLVRLRREACADHVVVLAADVAHRATVGSLLVALQSAVQLAPGTPWESSSSSPEAAARSRGATCHDYPGGAAPAWFLASARACRADAICGRPARRLTGSCSWVGERVLDE